ncbi:hypothetical protein EDC96DRAFT_532707 [Choanephora cucurbitarum]|nr:hypothetical protein EDC96DRAFT_532707 [Choanephora cucurbitarum]
MSEEAQVGFLEACGIYAFKNSIASNSRTARVVSLPDLKAHLSETCPSTLSIIFRLYNSLEFFLKGAGREMVRSGMIRAWSSWNYEIMTMANYMNDKRHDHHYFSTLTKHQSNSTLLFVFYLKEDKRRFEQERVELKQKAKKQGRSESANTVDPPKRFDPISNEIFELCHTMQPTEKFFKDTRSLLKRIQSMLDTIWPEMNYRIAIFGSTANLLGLKNADIDLCIVVPEAKFEHDLRTFRKRLSRQPRSVYNMYYLAARLRDIGMKAVESIGHASVPICKFIDPQTGFNCDINTNNILGIENTRLIGTYANLDVRIRPLLAAIKQFVKEKNINNPRGGTLSSYAYVIMALHFLMVGLEQPLIPSLQKLSVRCQSRNCNSITGKIVSQLQDHQIVQWDARYHDCLNIRNIATSVYKMSPSVGKNDTITYWEGKNKDSVSHLLTKFFEYYSDPSNYVVSIITQDGELHGNYDISYWRTSPIIVQDPFILNKNVARSCTVNGAGIIFQEFKRAAQLLKKNTPFSTVCDKQYNIARTVDTECMEYRLQIQKQHTNSYNWRQHVKLPSTDAKHSERQGGTYNWRQHLKSTTSTSVEVTKVQNNDNLVGDLDEKNLDEVIEILKPIIDPVEEETQQQSEKMLRELSQSNEATKNQKEQKQFNTTPKSILKLVEKIMENQPSSATIENLTMKPCMDMHALLKESFSKESFMSEMGIHDLYYLMAQLNFLDEVITDSLLEEMTKDDKRENKKMKSMWKKMSTTERLASFMLAVEADRKRKVENTNENLTPKPSSPETEFVGLAEEYSPSEDDEDEYNSEQMNNQFDEYADEYEEEDENYEEEDDDEEYDSEFEILTEEEVKEDFDDDDIVDVYFYVEDVPACIDSYELYQHLYWYGEVYSATPALTKDDQHIDWFIHLKTKYVNYEKRRLPSLIQLDDYDDCVVSLPRLHPH